MINTKPLIKFLLWTFTLFLVCIVGISGVFADTYENIGYLSDNSEVLVEVGYVGNPLPLQKEGEYQLEQVYAMNINVSNFTFLGGTTYSLEFWTPKTKLQYANAFTIVGNDSNNRPVNCATIGINSENLEFINFKFNCSSNVNYINLRIYNSSNSYIMDPGLFSWKYVYLRKLTGGTDTSILEAQNAQIIQGQQDIINNNNTNTDKIIEENKKNFNDCHYSYNLLNVTATSTNSASGLSIIVNNDKSITINGTNSQNSTYFFRLAPNFTLPPGTYTLSNGYTNANFNKIIFYDDNHNIPANGNITTATFSSPVTISPYIRIGANQTINNVTIYPMIQKGSTATGYEEFGKEICVNKLDVQKDAIDNVDNTLKDDNVDDNGVADAFESFNDYLDDNSTITQLITLPITLYTAILNNLNGTCQPFNLGQLYGENLILPCINISQYLGNSLWTMIDIIISGFAVYAISKKMIKVFNNFSSLREGDVIDD